ncbi:MAG: aminodeoxychorismate lyase [Thiobacillus sp.]
MRLVNGQLNGTLDVRDRGLAYGDGVFRTLRTEAGKPLWWRDHLTKLGSDCAALGLPCPDADVLYHEVCELAEATAGVVKIVITRGAGARGYAPPDAQPATRLVLSSPLPDYAQTAAPNTIRARWCALRLSRQPRLAGVKHLNRLENVLARAEWRDPAVFEGLLCDDTGAVIGGTMSNLLCIIAGELHTPDLDECGVAGVARSRLLRAAERHGLKPHIGRLTPAVILAADELMICNSVMGLRQIGQLGDTFWPPGRWFSRLQKTLNEDLD